MTNDPSKLLLGTGEFHFAEGCTTVAQARAKGFLDIGNIQVVNLDPGSDNKEHFGAYRGVVRKDDIRRIKSKLDYKLTTDEFHQFAIQLFYQGIAVGNGATSQAALAAVAGAQIVFSNGSPSGAGLWYDLLNAGGAPVHDLTSVTFGGGLVEGTDFVLDRKLGRVQFLTQQSAAVTPTITAAAIVAGQPGSYNQINPLTAPAKTGIGRIFIFDQNDKNSVVWSHLDFSCDITLASASDVKSDDYSQLALTVAVTNLPGTVNVRA